MSLKDWWDGMFGHRSRPPEDTDARVILTREESSQATRLSRLTGKTRDEVLREAYRKSDAILAGYEAAEAQRLGRK